MKLVHDVLGDPVKTGILTVGAGALSHFFFSMDLLVTGGIVAVGAFLTYKAYNKKS